MNKTKTVQAQKISAMWTPHKFSPAAGFFRVAGGKLKLEAAFAADMANPSAMIRNAEAIEETKEMLAGCGVLHSFTVSAGRVDARFAIDAQTGLPVAGDEPGDDAGDDVGDDLGDEGDDFADLDGGAPDDAASGDAVAAE